MKGINSVVAAEIYEWYGHIMWVYIPAQMLKN